LPPRCGWTDRSWGQQRADLHLPLTLEHVQPLVVVRRPRGAVPLRLRGAVPLRPQ
jgi:hypothetical protein